VAAEAHARRIAQAGHQLIADSGEYRAIALLGPADPPIALIRARHRVRLILKAPRSAPLQALIRAMLRAAGNPKGGARVDVDIDPVSFY
jgi:primosomal protein N' (replication factor Y)